MRSQLPARRPRKALDGRIPGGEPVETLIASQSRLRPGARLALCGLALALLCTPLVRNQRALAGDPYLIYRNPELNKLSAEQALERLGVRETMLDDGAPLLTPGSELGRPLDLRNDRGVAFAKAGWLDRAEAELEAARDLADDELLPVLNLARLYWLLDERESVRRVFSELSDDPRRSPEQLYALALDLAPRTRDGERVLFMEAIAERRRHPEALLWLAAESLAARNYAGARAYYERVLARNANEPRALFGQGYVQYKAGDWKRAALYLERAAAAGSQEPTVHRLGAEALFRTGRHEKALELLAKASPEERRAREALLLAGRIRLELDYRAVLSDLIQLARASDRPILLREWYGSSEADRASLEKIRTEFQYLD